MKQSAFCELFTQPANEPLCARLPQFKSSALQVDQIDPLLDPRWSAFVLHHPNSSVFHTVGWLQALQCSYGYKPSAVATTDADGNLVGALVFCEIDSWMTGRRIVSLPFSDHCDPLVNSESELHDLTTALVELARTHGCKHVELRPRSDEPLPRFDVCDHYYLHRLDLQPGEKEVFRRFQRDSIQRKIRRAEREKLRVEFGHTPELVEDFYKLVLRTRRRHGLPAQPIAWFRNLAACLNESMVIRLAYHAQRPIAGILTLEHRKTMMYKYGASDERFHNLGGMACTFWHALREAMQRGLEEMDMGRSDLDNPGLIAFKEHWGATRNALAYWKCPPTRARGIAPRWGMRLAHRACNYAPDFLLGAMGSLLYRHVG